MVDALSAGRLSIYSFPQQRTNRRPTGMQKLRRPPALAAQLLAYHTAVFMGKDVDQPRNLAKSVTVE